MKPEVASRLDAARAQLRDRFGTVVLAMMQLPRYRDQSLRDLTHLVLDPLMQDRVALAYPQEREGGVAGIALWASVSEEVDARIREQVKARVFPIRLKPEDWTSGDINWLFDVIAPDQATTARLIANLRQVIRDGDLRLHPVIATLVDEATLARMTGGSRV